MSMKKWITVSAMLLLTIALLATSGPLSAFAKSGAYKETMEKTKAIEVELNDDYFNPKVITIPQGTPTTIVLSNKGKEEHTFTVKKLGIDAEVEPGKEKTITVQPKKPGTYKLICRYHYKEGMVGKIVVK
ncbi:plastocyanin [Scopulibacillus darangshiensis]|uniref:Plastocyanin n=1 Tax=Scopulibacillus darangshiensis TaxID=442528 RepID=A0A4R2NUD3_9BACL|nr:cupredoxin domain-containing protein [Scopulibacillus darangshiensis]TCP25600.1 plastocyanin [Scopulibacillus darangshiensis]